MRNVINSIVMVSLSLVAGTLLIAATGQQSQEPNTPPQQEPQSSQGQGASQGQATSSAMVQSVTGCVIQGDHGYSLKTESDTYPIETDKDLSQYVNKQVKITGILEHHNASAPQAEAGSTATVTDVRLRMVATVIGDCNQPQK